MRAGIALGSNLGDRLAQLRAAQVELRALPDAEAPFLASSIYETEPVDCEPEAARFLNAVLEIGYVGDAQTLLRELRRIEAVFGRPAAHARNTSRRLDLDLLYFDDLMIESAELQLPHPRMHERRFVLEPLSEIRPDLVLPGQTATVATLLRRLPATPPLLRGASEW
jgi:2-amino-4-hydroxy-6-hydroxymethyldihydropteridine diphosphokinase